MFSVLYHQGQSVSTAERDTHLFTALTTFQIVFGRLYHKMESIDCNAWDRYGVCVCVPVFDAFVHYRHYEDVKHLQDDFVKKKYHERVCF